MKDFKFYDRVVGWAAFLVAAVCYLLTVEPTASWWDCGEFIATAVKLEVGHPPGAPLWMIIGRVAALFAPDDAHMALMMNATAALAAAFTSLFLFWSVTHLARRIVEKISYKGQNVASYSACETVAILSSGMVGALIYTFCDTAWFSAVEAEVYSMSSLFTAVVFWLILKWEEHADEKYSNRWLILICYLMGLSIGVHLLNLLVIPAIVLVYYYKKYKPTPLGTTLALLLSVVILAVVLYFIIPQTVNIAAHFDLLFVNTFGMPYYSGIITFMLLLMGGLGYLVWWTHANRKVILNTISLGVFVLMVGYCSFAMTVIRSFANPPINENDPSNGFSLLSYLNREQYGDNPLFYGPYFNAEPTGSVQESTYIPFDGKYLKIDKPRSKYTYSSEDQGFFPRMYSSNQNHIQVYKTWGGLESVETRPSFAENLTFFFTYQLGHMYFRYFMWNFVGRQSDIQNGAGSVINGNWISGIDFIDAIKGASSDGLPDKYKNNHGRNVYYFLPFLLGLLGIFVSLQHDSKNCFVVFMFFLLTGIAIVVYLNQTPYQPRERDYAYAGSFYAFSIWCGLGALAIWNIIRNLGSRDNRMSLVGAGVSCVAVLVPVQMACQNWDDHDRSGRYTCRDFAINYLESCAPNSILFTFGDNDTFPLWYVQEVEGVRRDVRIVNLSLAGCDWYLKQTQEKKYNSEPVKMTLSPNKYRQDLRNIVIVTDQGSFASGKYNQHKDEIDAEYFPLYKDFMSVIDNSNFPSKFAKDYQTISAGPEKFPPTMFASLVSQLVRPEISKQIFGDNNDGINGIKSRTDLLIAKISGYYTPIKDALTVTADDNDKLTMANGDQYNYLPSKKISVPVNVDNCLKNGTLSEATKQKALAEVKWDISKSYFTKSDLAVMDIICANNWERPIYFASSASAADFLGLEKYMRLEGFAYRLVPYVTEQKGSGEIGDVDSKIMYDNVMTKFKWGRVNEPDVVIEENNRRQIAIMDIRGILARLSEKLADDGELEKAKEVANKCLEILPKDKVAFDYSMLPVVGALYKAGLKAEAEKISMEMADEHFEIFNWLSKLKAQGFNESREYGMSLNVIGYLTQQAFTNEASKSVADHLNQIYKGCVGFGIDELPDGELDE